MKARTLSLKDLKNVEWEAINPVRSPRWKLDPDSMSVRIRKVKSSDTIRQVRIRFGAGLLKKLKWKVGDKICPHNNKDDFFTFMLAKTEAGEGYRVCKETNSPITVISFQWHKEGFIFPEMPAQEVEFLTPSDKYIVFRISEDIPQ